MKTVNSGIIGTYAVSTISFDTWISQPVIGETKGKKNKIDKEIYNRIFAECTKYIDDPYWMSIFSNAVYGKFPTKFSYREEKLQYKRGTKNHTLEIPTSAYEAKHACIDFFQTYGGLSSPTDKQILQERQFIQAKQAQDNFVALGWDSAGKKTRDSLISFYIEDMKKLMKLNHLETKQLRQTIKLGIHVKILGKHNITISDKRIQAIEGLFFDGEKRNFYINPSLKPLSARKATKVKEGESVFTGQKDFVPQFNPVWQKFSENLNSRAQASLRKKITINHVENDNFNTSNGYNPTDGTTETDNATSTHDDFDVTDDVAEEEEFDYTDK